MWSGWSALFIRGYAKLRGIVVGKCGPFWPRCALVRLNPDQRGTGVKASIVGLISVVLFPLLVSAAPPAVAERQLRLTISFVTADGSPLSEETFDLAGLDALEQGRVVTTTPWTRGVQSFTGPLLGGLARLNGNVTQKVREVRVMSWADWSVTIPASDWARLNVILATRLNGNTMRVREKGPYWIMYPIGDTRGFDTQMYQARMMWQVKSLEFVVE